MEKILRHEKIIIAVVLIITAFFAIQIPEINIDNDIKVFLPDDNPSKVTYNRIEDIFGAKNRMIVAVNIKDGTIFTAENIALIQNLTGDFSSITGVDEVTSLTNADFIEGTEDGMVVEELAGKPPENNDDIYNLKRKLLSWDFYKQNLYNDKFTATQILVNLKDNLTNDEKDDIYYRIEDIADNYTKEGVEIYIAGASAVNVLMGDSMVQDIIHLIPFVIIVLILSLVFFFRKLTPVILTMITVTISTIWAVGLMALLEINMTLVSTVIPVLLLAVGSAYGIHILSHYYDRLHDEENNLTEKEHRGIVVSTIKQIGKPVFLAGLTTVVGFGSLATSEIVPIKTFGIFTAVGIIAAFVVAIFLIPAILLLKSEKNIKRTAGKKVNRRLESIIMKLHEFYSARKISILIFSLIIIAVSIVGMTKIVIDTPLIEMFKEDTEVRQADDFLNSNFSGTSLMNVMVEGQGKGSLTDPEILKQMDNLDAYLTKNIPEVGKVISITDFIKRMNRIMHYPDTSSFYSDSSDSQAEKETTSSFYSDSSDGQEDKETTSSFYSDSGDNSTGEENTSRSSSADSSNGMEKDSVAYNSEPDSSISSEYQLVKLLNDALTRADKLDLSGEELINLVNNEINYRGARFNEIPYDVDKYPVSDKQGLKNLVSQYLLLYSGNLDDMINDQLEPDKAQMIVQIKSPSNLVAAKVEKEIKDFSEEKFPEGYSVKISGYADMGLAANNLIVHSQTMSILVSFIIVFLIVAVSYKSLVAGFYGIIPLAFSLLINFGLMGYSGIKLDIGTAMVASLAIGIGVDYTIHFLDGYHKERKKSDDLYQVTGNTLKSVGKAIIFNAVSVAAGFMVLVFSNFYPLVYLGLLVTVTMLTSSLASLTILPLLLNIFKPKFISK